MRTTDVRRGFVLALTVALFTIPTAAHALRSGRVADCLDCHRMHLSSGGSPIVEVRNFANVARRYRLQANDQSTASTATRRPPRPATSLAAPVIAPAPAAPGAASVPSM